MKNVEIKPHLSSCYSPKPTMSVRESVTFLENENARTIIDVGAGKLRNSLYLGDIGFEITAQDLKEALDGQQVKINKAIEQNRIKGCTDSLICDTKYDAALCNYVVNVIPEKEERENLIYRINDLLKDGGLLVFDARADRYYVERGRKYKDGYLMKWGKAFTFQRTYGLKEVEKLLFDHNFEIEKVFKKYKSVSLLARKNKSDRKFGQMWSSQISEMADYVQFPISGLTPEEVVEKLKNARIKLPLMLHGDWERNASPDTILDKNRQGEYIQIINCLREEGYRVLGLTIHPPKRKKGSMDDLIKAVKTIHEETDALVLVENRSNPKYMVSIPEEIKYIADYVPVTLDIQGLYIALGYDKEKIISSLKELRYCQNIRELHIGDVKRGRVCLGLGRGDLFECVKDVLPPARYRTIEVLGGRKTFDEAVERLQG